MPDLITLSYLQSSLAAGGVTLSADQLAAAPAMISAASDLICRWCSRDFVQASYTEQARPDRDGRIDLRQFPVASVARVVAQVPDAFVVVNTDATSQRASATATATGLVLARKAGTTTTTNTLTYAAYPTLGLLADAIDLLGNGWSASATADYAGWASADLSADSLPRDARRQAWLPLWADDLGVGRFAPATGQLWIDSSACWGGLGCVQVTYTAGYSPVPASVQQTTAEVVKGSLDRLSTDGTISREKMGRYEYETTAQQAFAAIPAASLQALASYRVHF